ncbi:hypothetical protein ABEB36_003899, partial [Hypothenemus hampei]
AGTVGDQLIGPFVLPHKLNKQHYLEFLINDLPNLLEKVGLQLRVNMWHLNDEARIAGSVQ